jgi:hypothetical protein
VTISDKYAKSGILDKEDAKSLQPDNNVRTELVKSDEINGKVCPVLMYDRKLSAAELNLINLYFKNRYLSFTTPTPTPTASPTPTPTTSPIPSPTPTPLPFIEGYSILVNDTTPSYPGTGTTWTSLATGTTYNGSLLFGPVWSGGTPGFFTFDGTNDECDFGQSSSGATTNSCTFGAWFRTVTGTTQTMIAMRGRTSWSLMIAKESNNKIGIEVAATSPGLSGVRVDSTTTLVSNTWYNVYGVWNEGTDCKIYVNGVLENTGSFDRTSLRVSTTGWVLARGNSNYTNADISEFVTYNRILTDAEILNNFNNNKSKYGY